MYVAAALELREGDRSRLESLTRASTVRAGLARRARIVLLAAEGVANTDIADRTETSRPTVLKWRGRYGESGIDGLVDEPRPGRARGDRRGRRCWRKRWRTRGNPRPIWG